MLESYLPSKVVSALINLPYDSICEIRIRADNPIIINIMGENFYLASDSVTKNPNEALNLTIGDIQVILEKISNHSLYTINDMLIEGYVTIKGGIRVGVCGEVVCVDGVIKTIKNISSLNFRFPHFVRNCSLSIFPYIFKNNMIKSTLIISPPGAGKTTYLRDIVYQLTSKDSLLNVLIIDERQELSQVYDGNQVVNLKNVDVCINSSKKFGFINGIRSMKPDVIVTDEINIDKDLEFIENALTSGVKVIASIHASSIYDLKNKSCFQKLLSKKLFERFVVLSNASGLGTVDGVFDENLNFIGV